VVRDTIVADAARYYGASPLTAPAGVGDLRVSVASVRSALVPAAQTEIPIVDARPNQSIAGALAAGGGGELTITTAANFDEDTALYVGGSILPGSLTMSGAASLYDRAGVLLDAAGAQVGTVDYVNGVLTPPPAAATRSRRSAIASAPTRAPHRCRCRWLSPRAAAAAPGRLCSPAAGASLRCRS
jgi:hypothetical protein